MSENSLAKRQYNTDHLKPHQFKPGQSGNPGGQPKDPAVLKRLRKMSSENLREALTILLETPYREAVEILKDPDAPMFKRWVLNVADRGCKKGDASALDIILNRVVGKPREFVDVDVQVTPNLPTPKTTDMIATALRTASRELTRLEAKQSLTETEQRSLSTLSKTVVELSSEEQKLKSQGGYATLGDNELMEKARQAVKYLEERSKVIDASTDQDTPRKD